MALQRQAPRAGGKVITLVGNHEVMNVIGDLRYVTPAIFATFATPRFRADAREGVQGLPEVPRRPRGSRPRRRPSGRRGGAPDAGWTSIPSASSSTGRRSGRTGSTASGSARTSRRAGRRRRVRARRTQSGARVRQRPRARRARDGRCPGLRRDVARAGRRGGDLAPHDLRRGRAVRRGRGWPGGRPTGPVGEFKPGRRLCGCSATRTGSPSPQTARSGTAASPPSRKRRSTGPLTAMLERLKAALHRGRPLRRRQQRSDDPVRQPRLPDRHGHARGGLLRPGERAGDPGRPLHGAPGGHDAEAPGPSGKCKGPCAGQVDRSRARRPPPGA